MQVMKLNENLMLCSAIFKLLKKQCWQICVIPVPFSDGKINITIIVSVTH